MRTFILLRRFGFAVSHFNPADLTYIRPILEYACLYGALKSTTQVILVIKLSHYKKEPLKLFFQTHM